MKKRLLSAVCVAVLFSCLFTVPSFAYFNRGAVTMQLGQTSVSVAEGKSVSVSVTVNPISEQQLPGCGMAECPQSCGNTGCLNEYGECTCGGTTYQTYYSSVKAVSGNSSVASASYANGTLTIRGVSAGTTNITVTGSMRQYTDASQTISVTVTSSGSGTSGASGGTQKTPAGGQSGAEDPDAAVVTQVPDDTQQEDSSGDGTDGSDGQTDRNGETGEEDGANGAAGSDSEVLTTKRGVYEIVTLGPDTDVKAHLQAAADNQRFVTFQKKQGENVEYSWTFDGKKLKEAGDLDGKAENLSLDLDISGEIPQEYRQQLNGTALYLRFDHEGELPAEAEMYVQVSSAFDDGESLKLYRCGGEDEAAEPAAEDITVENGYVTFGIDHCSSYILTDGDLSQQSGSFTAVILIIIAAVAAAAVVLFLLFRRKKQGQDKIFR